MPMSSKAAHDSRQRSSKATEISTLHADVKQGCPRFKAKKFQGNRDLHPACRCQARLPTIQGNEVPRQQRSPPCMPMSSKAAHDSRQRSSKATEIFTFSNILWWRKLRPRGQGRGTHCYCLGEQSF